MVKLTEKSNHAAKVTFAVVAMVALAMGPVQAVKPGETVNPNGFPSGEHYNLNIHGKKAGFTCPAPEVDEFGNPVYGNSIFIPENGNGFQLYMESGKGTKAAAIPTLQATDPCATDGSRATIQIPKNEAGYKVYARILAKPTDNPSILIRDPELVLVEDELGNELIELGLVDSNGVFTQTSASYTRGKGKSTATEITDLFKWSGDIYYFTAPASGDYTTEEKCCTDNEPVDGIWDSCVDPVVVDAVTTCETGTLTAVYGVSYKNEWVFNVGDWVEYLWNLDNNGSKLLQVRFYPQS